MNMRKVKANYDKYCREYDSNEEIEVRKEILLDKIQKLEECIDILYEELNELRKQTFKEFCDSWVDYNREE